MDFYMVSSLSILATKHQNKEFKLISDDKGFAHSFEALKKYGGTNSYELLSDNETITNKNTIKTVIEKSTPAMSANKVQKMIRRQVQDFNLSDRHTCYLSNELTQIITSNKKEVKDIGRRVQRISNRYNVPTILVLPIITEFIGTNVSA